MKLYCNDCSESDTSYFQHSYNKPMLAICNNCGLVLVDNNGRVITQDIPDTAFNEYPLHVNLIKDDYECHRNMKYL